MFSCEFCNTFKSNYFLKHLLADVFFFFWLREHLWCNQVLPYPCGIKDMVETYLNHILLKHVIFLFWNVFGRRQRGPIRSVLLVIIGWLVGWLVGNAVFSETALSIFLIFCMKLGDYKGRKVTEPGFWKKFLIWRYSQKGLQMSPKSDTLIFFSKTAQRCFWFLVWS